MKSKLKEIFTVDPYQEMNSDSPGEVCNLLKGEWIQGTRFREDIPDPLNGEPFLKVPDTTEYSEFINSLDSCPKSGLHNPCLLYTSPSPRDVEESRMPSSA